MKESGQLYCPETTKKENSRERKQPRKKNTKEKYQERKNTKKYQERNIKKANGGKNAAERNKGERTKEKGQRRRDKGCRLLKAFAGDVVGLVAEKQQELSVTEEFDACTGRLNQRRDIRSR